MSSPISGIGSIMAPGAIQAPAPAGAKGPGGFQNLFEKAVSQVDGLRANANQAVEQFLSGETDELHGTVLATQKAELAFELFLQVRNKVVQAYQEVMRMQM